MRWLRRASSSIIPDTSREISREAQSRLTAWRHRLKIEATTRNVTAQITFLNEVEHLWNSLGSLNRAIVEHGSTMRELDDAEERYKHESRMRKVEYMKGEMQYWDVEDAYNKRKQSRGQATIDEAVKEPTQAEAEFEKDTKNDNMHHRVWADSKAMADDWLKRRGGDNASEEDKKSYEDWIARLKAAFQKQGYEVG